MVEKFARRESIWPESVRFEHLDLWDPIHTEETFRSVGSHDVVVFAACADGPDIGGLAGPNVKLLGHALNAIRDSGLGYTACDVV